MHELQANMPDTNEAAGMFEQMPRRSEWPELLGSEVDRAQEAILRDQPDLTLEIVSFLLLLQNCQQCPTCARAYPGTLGRIRASLRICISVKKSPRLAAFGVSTFHAVCFQLW